MTTAFVSKPHALAIGITLGLPLVISLHWGCSRASKPGGEAKPETSVAPASTATDEKPDDESASASASGAPSAAPVATGCEGKMQEFDKVLSEATYNCSKDADCQCFPGGLSRGRGSECGGIVEVATGKKLAAIEKAAKPMSCSNGSMCEPWTCDPICEENRCQKGPRKAPKKK